VHRALAYYHDNPGEMREIEKEVRRMLRSTIILLPTPLRWANIY
jgi:hypothetical protein